MRSASHFVALERCNVVAFPAVTHTSTPPPLHPYRWKEKKTPRFIADTPTTKRDYKNKIRLAHPTLHDREAVDAGNRQLAGRAQRPAAIGEVEQRGVFALSRRGG